MEWLKPERRRFAIWEIVVLAFSPITHVLKLDYTWISITSIILVLAVFGYRYYLFGETYPFREKIVYGIVFVTLIVIAIYAGVNLRPVSL